MWQTCADHYDQWSNLRNFISTQAYVVKAKWEIENWEKIFEKFSDISVAGDEMKQSLFTIGGTTTDISISENGSQI